MKKIIKLIVVGLTGTSLILTPVIVSSLGFLDTKLRPDSNIPGWETLSGVLVALTIFFVLLRESKLRKLKTGVKVLLVSIFFAAVAVGWSSFLLPGTAGDKPHTTLSDNAVVVRFPLTGGSPLPQTLVESLKSLYGTPMAGLITSFLLVLIAFMTFKIVKPTRAQVERDLEDAKKAARNVLRDLEAEKRRLAEANAKDEALLESIGEGVVATNQEGKMIIMNKVAEVLLGFTSRELMGKSFIKEVALEDSQGKQLIEKEQPIILALTEGKTSTIATYHFVRKDGTKIPVAMIATPVLLDARPTGTIVVFRDITKEKEIEKLRTDFLALASHQLRTPLSGTKWLIDTMQRGILGTMTRTQQEYLDYLYQINERMIKLVSEMLSILMLESNTLVIKKQEVQVSNLYEELFLMMAPAAQNKKITLDNKLNNRRELVLQTDLQALRSILESFVGNAINYSQNGTVIVCDAKEDPTTVTFSVKDRGIGIPKEEQGRVFERFYRSSNAKKFRPDGTGLGLYTAHLLAQKIGGKISFASKENEGTTFYLRMPKGVDSSGIIHNEHTT